MKPPALSFGSTSTCGLIFPKHRLPGRVVARLLPPTRVETALLFFAVELAPGQFVVGSCEAFHH
ncbi:MAG: hypothetical protein GY720_18770 [bacterium]|nr:hypothetical protein [bacterium]